MHFFKIVNQPCHGDFWSINIQDFLLQGTIKDLYYPLDD